MNDVEKMDLETEDEKRKRISWKVFIYLFLFIPISMIFSRFFFSVYTHFKYKNILANIEAKGESTSLSECEFPEIPNEKNGAIYIIEAMKQPWLDEDGYMDHFDVEYNSSSFTGLDYNELKDSAEELEIIRGWIKANNMTLELIKQGLQNPDFDYKFDYSDKKTWESGEFYMRNDDELRDLLEYKAYISIFDNDNTQAIDDFKTLIEFGITWRKELTWHNYVNRLFCYETALKVLKNMIENLELTCEEIDILSLNLDRLSATLNIKEFLIQERCFILDYLDYINSYESNDPFYIENDILYHHPQLTRIVLGDKNIVRDILLKSVNYQTKLIEMADKPYAAIKNQLNTMIERTRGFLPYWDDVANDSGLKLFQSHFDDIALYRIVQTTLAIKKFEIINKRIPKNLEELIEVGLITEMPRSPFTNQQLIYEIENGKYRLFCPGSNGEYFKNIYACIGDFENSTRVDIEWKYED